MNMLELTDALSKLGNIDIIKKEYVFTLLMRGNNLSKAGTFIKIQKMVIDYAGKEFPIIEAMKTDDNIFFIILKPNV